MKDIFYMPVFNQSAPSVWDDFARIRAAAMTVNYNAKPSKDEITHWLSDYKNQYRRSLYNFGFAAYCDTEMVGFIRGVASRCQARIRCFYVLPEYQGQNIGKTLLRYAERSIAPITKNVELTSLLRAEKFYKHNNYRSVYGTNVYSKRLPSPSCYTTALFGCTTHIAKSLDTLGADTDVISQIAPSVPLYVYYDAAGNPDGILIGCADSNDIKLLRTKFNSPKDWAHHCLTSAYDTYINNKLRLEKTSGR